ncbi:MAG: low affinity iron permease family protein [Flavisolibacter sp.]|nr:low affinity iron permease family protein [Flavisolibacter sp.]MBD0298378.1 low affinity iron permease family protein [Flavisolibacter sp.]MBD0353005.1 low affinity iron permease family protein [Flavisolibacter sp.]MBD0374925.1 low affinity iron permease family protein [Flavisolibacter sp.]
MSNHSNTERNATQELDIDPSHSPKRKKGFSAWFEKTAAKATKVTGSSTAFIIAVLIIIVWAVTGPIFHYSDTWQLVINTGTTIVTFLMVFIIQQTQNKDSLALQLKLNELIACDERASNRLIVVEDLTQEELEMLKNFYVKLAELAKKHNDLHSSHSVDDASHLHEHKYSLRHRHVAEETKKA